MAMMTFVRLRTVAGYMSMKFRMFPVSLVSEFKQRYVVVLMEVPAKPLRKTIKSSAQHGKYARISMQQLIHVNVIDKIILALFRTL
jgi:hypothetical protein